MRHTRQHLHQIVAPGLILHSSHDDVASLKSATMVQRRIRANDVRLVQLHDSYHMITLDNEREHVATLTVNFFNDYRQAEQTGTHPAAIAL